MTPSRGLDETQVGVSELTMSESVRAGKLVYDAMIALEYQAIPESWKWKDVVKAWRCYLAYRKLCRVHEYVRKFETQGHIDFGDNLVQAGREAVHGLESDPPHVISS